MASHEEVYVMVEPEQAAPALAARKTVVLIQAVPEIEFINARHFNARWTAWVIDGANRSPVKAANNLLPILQKAHEALHLETATPTTYEHTLGLMPAWEIKFETNH